MRAAGLMRPRAQSNPELTGLTNKQLETHELQRHGRAIEAQDARIRQNEDAIKAISHFIEGEFASLRATDTVVVRALRLEEQLPPEVRGNTDPPPPEDGKRKSKKPAGPALDVIERDSVKAKVASYAIVVFTVAKIAWDVFHGGK